MANDNIYQFKITLRGISPEIYRTVLVEEETTFFEFHHIIQIAMGWFNAHLYQFTNHDVIISDPSFIEYAEAIDSEEASLNQFFKKEGDKLEYEYDFGDGWIHEILLEKIGSAKEDQSYPMCIDGKRNCPPEDCGGVWGYQDLVNVMKDPNHPEFENIVKWFGDVYDPEYFDIEEVNIELEHFMDEGLNELFDIHLN